MPEEALEAQWQAAPDPFTRAFSSLMLGVARGGAATTGDRDERPFPIAPRSVRDYAADLAAGKEPTPAPHA